jgi:nicotinamidase-related amidase
MTEKEKKAVALVIIDPQNDFCDPQGALYVPGAEQDMARLARHIEQEGDKYAAIFVSLDSHNPIAIFHPRFWLDEKGSHPAPFTAISLSEHRSKVWRTACPQHEPYAQKMFAALAEKNLSSLMVWPEHCLVSNWGHGLVPQLAQALANWQQASRRPLRYVFKGENPYTEQYSIFEGLDSSWPDCAFKQELQAALSGFAELVFAGEALSHCVAESIVSYLQGGNRPGPEQSQSLLCDCTSAVTGFDRRDCEAGLQALGVHLIRS